MTLLETYINQVLAESQEPQIGDKFDFELREQLVIECRIVEKLADAIVVETNRETDDLLESYGIVFEGIKRYGPVESSPGKGYTHGEYEVGKAHRPRFIDVPPKEPAKDINPEAVGSMRERPDGSRERRTAGGWQAASGPVAHRPRAIEEGVMSEIDIDLRHIGKTESFDALQDALGGQFGTATRNWLENRMMEIGRDHRLHYDDNIDEIMELLMDELVDQYGSELDEAEYQGRDVDLNKPTRGDVKKFKVYVKDPSTGNVKKVNFGDPNMRIKKSNPDRRRSFRARHRCDTAKDKTTARYWSCRKW